MISMRAIFAFATVFVAAACGGKDVSATMHVSLRQHQLQCDIPGLQARLEVSVSGGVKCPLTVNADRTITGSCPSIPTGNVVDVRLLYFVLTECAGSQSEVELASAIISVDLTGATSPQMDVSFAESNLERDIDQDTDGESNLVEVCQAKNPCGM